MLSFISPIRSMPRRDRVIMAISLLLSLVVVGLPLLRYARYLLSIRPDLNDWEVFWAASSFRREWQALSEMETFRPFAHLPMGLSYKLFGLNVKPLAAFYFVVEVVSAMLIALVFRTVGIRGPLLALAVIAGFFSPPNLSTGAFLACHEPALGRFWAVATVLALLRPEGERYKLWLITLLLAAGSHEIFVTILPLYLVCVITRDGWSGLRALGDAPKFRSFSIAFFVVLALRFLLYARAEKTSHELSISALGSNIGQFFFALFLSIRDTIDPVRPLYFGLIVAAFVLVARSSPTVLNTKELFRRARTISGWYVWLVIPLGAVSVFLAGALLNLVSAAHPRREFIRELAFGLAWAVASFTPFFFASSYTTDYYLLLSTFGFGLLIALPLKPLWSLSRSLAWRIAVVPLLAGFVISYAFHEPLQRPLTAGDLVRPYVEKAIEEAGSSAARAIFIEDDVAASPWLNSRFSDALSASAHSNRMFAVVFPQHTVLSAFLVPEHLPWLTIRKGETILRVRHEDHSFSVQPTAPPEAATDVPSALSGARPASIPVDVWDDARFYWSARANFADDKAIAVAARLASRGPPEKEESHELRFLREAIEATVPLVPPRDRRYATYHDAPPTDVVARAEGRAATATGSP